MKSIFLLILFIFFSEAAYSQVLSTYETTRNPIYIEASLVTNITSASKVGTGIRLSGGYTLSNKFSFIISTGYMTSYADKRDHIIQRMFDFNTQQYTSTTQYESERQFQIVPVALSLKYSIPLFGVKTYALLRGGWDHLFNYGNYSVTNEKRNESTNQILESKSGNAESMFGISNNVNNFGIGLGVGILIPITNIINLDASYLLLQNSFYPTMHSFGVGVNYNL